MHKSINILILSAGRRVELVNCFRSAAFSLGIYSKIIAVDASDTAPALYFADRFYIVPLINSEKYLANIIDICQKESISLVVPTIDTGLLELAEQKENFENHTGSKVLVSTKEIVKICRNKILAHIYLEKNGFGVPKLITQREIVQGTVKFPLFIKPQSGSSSINAFRIDNMEQLLFFRNQIKDSMVQEFVMGEEYTIDIFLDFKSQPITIVPRKRLETRSGEVSKSVIDKNRLLIETIMKLLIQLKPIGQITIQCIKNEKDIKFIEINPRFGGGTPMSIAAGADSCQNLYRLMMGQELRYNEDYQDRLMFLRFDDCICLDENQKVVSQNIGLTMNYDTENSRKKMKDQVRHD